MGLPEKSAVGVLALGATALVVCGLFFCGEAQEIQQGIEVALTPPPPVLELVQGTLEAPEPHDIPRPPDCPQAIVDDLDVPLATRADPDGKRSPCTWYQRKGLKPVWVVRASEPESGDRRLADRTLPVIRSMGPLAGPRPGHYYRVRTGDTLPALAHAAYGDVARWTDIWKANLERLRQRGDDIQGMELLIPE